MNDKLYSILNDMDAKIADIHTIQGIIASNIVEIGDDRADVIELVNRMTLQSVNCLCNLTVDAHIAVRQMEQQTSTDK